VFSIDVYIFTENQDAYFSSFLHIFLLLGVFIPKFSFMPSFLAF
jgi:hypothetical protein